MSFKGTSSKWRGPGYTQRVADDIQAGLRRSQTGAKEAAEAILGGGGGGGTPTHTMTIGESTHTYYGNPVGFGLFGGAYGAMAPASLDYAGGGTYATLQRCSAQMAPSSPSGGGPYVRFNVNATAGSGISVPGSAILTVGFPDLGASLSADIIADAQGDMGATSMYMLWGQEFGNATDAEIDAIGQYLLTNVGGDVPVILTLE